MYTSIVHWRIAAQLGVEPNTALGQAYLIPYGNQCQFQLGYKGMLDLAYRTGEVRSITAEVVREGDVFEYELGLNPKLRHVPAQSGRGKAIYYYMPLKTEFVKAVAQDEAVKNFDVGEENKDILDKPNEWVDADVNVVDEETGEVI